MQMIVNHGTQIGMEGGSIWYNMGERDDFLLKINQKQNKRKIKWSGQDMKQRKGALVKMTIV